MNSADGTTNAYPAFGKQISNWYAQAASDGKKSLPNAIAIGFELKSLDLAKASAAFMAVVMKHESLRTTFRVEAGEIKQVVNACSETDFALTYSSCKSIEALVRKKKLLIKQIIRTFRDLGRGPLCRGVVMEVEGVGYYFMFVIHHIVSDNWSLNSLSDEFSAAYDAIEQGQAGLPEQHTLQLKDYVAAYYASNDEAAIATYWSDKLKDADECIDLRRVYDWYRAESGLAACKNVPVLKVNHPGAYLKRALTCTSGLVYSNFLDNSDQDRLANTAQQLGTTLEVLILACLGIVLRVVYGTNRVLMVSRLHSRFSGECAQVQGNLTSAIYSYVDQKDIHTCGAFVKAIHEEFFLSLDQLVYNPLITRNLPLSTGSHLCVNVLRESGYRQTDAGLPGLTSEKIYFPLNATVVFCSNCIVFKWGYNPLLFRGSVVKAIATRSVAIIRQILDDPQTRIEALGRHAGQDAFKAQYAQ